jgi:hypothetical protein
MLEGVFYDQFFPVCRDDVDRRGGSGKPLMVSGPQLPSLIEVHLASSSGSAQT